MEAKSSDLVSLRGPRSELQYPCHASASAQLKAANRCPQQPHQAHFDIISRLSNVMQVFRQTIVQQLVMSGNCATKALARLCCADPLLRLILGCCFIVDSLTLISTSRTTAVKTRASSMEICARSSAFSASSLLGLRKTSRVGSICAEHFKARLHGLV